MHSRELKIWPKYLCLEVLNWGILLEEGSAALLSQIRLTRRRDFSHNSSSPGFFKVLLDTLSGVALNVA